MHNASLDSLASDAKPPGGLRHLENPFLRRELRQLARRPRTVQVALLVCLSLMVAATLGWLAVATGPPVTVFGMLRSPATQAMIWLLIASHTLLCSVAAIYGCYRLFAAEHLRSTFELTQLLPYSPMRWLALKLAFPALGIVVAWLAGFPLYFLVALFGITRFNSLIFLMHKPLMAGVGILLIALLMTPEYLRRYQQQQAKIKGAARGARVDQDTELSVWTMFALLWGYALLAGLALGAGLSEFPRIFYGVWVPESLYWSAGFLLLAGAAIPTAITALVTHERLELRAHQARLWALIAAYFGFGGLIWGPLSIWYRLGFVLLPLWLWIASSIGKRRQLKRDERREDARSEREVQWIVARIPNALLMRDLRVYTRGLSISRYCLWMLGIIVAALLGWWGFIAYSGSGKSWAVFARIIPQIVLQMGIQCVAGAWSRPTFLWHKERSAKTLPSLLLTPLTSGEILLGRLLAAPIYHWGGQAPLVLLLLVGVVWAVVSGMWIIGPITLALLPVVLSMGVWLCCNPAGTMTKIYTTLWGVVLIVLQGLLLAAVVALGIGGLLTSGAWKVEPLMGWCLGLLLSLGNALVGWAWFGVKVKQLDAFRRSDMEVPDSKELAPQRPRRTFKLGRTRNASI